MTAESAKTIVEYPRNVSSSLLNNWDTVKSVHYGYHVVYKTGTNRIDLNVAAVREL